jgi:putative MFS transporter
MRAILAQKAIWVAALGYFVDLYDLVLYGAVRLESLRGIGVTGEAAFHEGAKLLNFQMAGMLAGGVLFGVIGDRVGRKSALFGSILLYSTATFLNAWITDLPSYAALRFLAGCGLAGELGVAVTLANELLPTTIRGMGSAWIASIGFFGAACSSMISSQLPWRTAYAVGGLLGFALLLARVGVFEPDLFLRAKKAGADASWGSLRLLLGSPSRVLRLIPAILAGVPIWYVAGILSYFAPELGKALEIEGEVSAGTTIFCGYVGAMAGDIACGLLSQRWKSRKRAVLAFMALGGGLALGHPWILKGAPSWMFYGVQGLIGFGNGYFATLVGWVSESFGTNLRVTATSVLANLIRASVIPLTLGFSALIPALGWVGASVAVGVACFGAGYWGVRRMEEGFGKDLDFLEGPVGPP